MEPDRGAWYISEKSIFCGSVDRKENHTFRIKYFENQTIIEEEGVVIKERRTEDGAFIGEVRFSAGASMNIGCFRLDG